MFLRWRDTVVGAPTLGRSSVVLKGLWVTTSMFVASRARASFRPACELWFLDCE